jgi:hypothetical protein
LVGVAAILIASVVASLIFPSKEVIVDQ